MRRVYLIRHGHPDFPLGAHMCLGRTDTPLGPIASPPSARDIWTRIWMGGRVSLTIAVVSALIDLVLGSIYGGVSGGFERKKNKSKARLIAKTISELIGESENVLIMGHRFSDYDAIGSAIGLFAIASHFGKKTNINAHAEKRFLCRPNAPLRSSVKRRCSLWSIPTKKILRKRRSF